MTTGRRVGAALIVLAICGCRTPSAYEDGVRIVRQVDQPSADEVLRARSLLDAAISSAKSRLDQKADASFSDAVAYIIPLARIAKARLNRRLQQVSEMESECWGAIQDAERYLGIHIRDLQDTVTTEDGDEANAAPRAPAAVHAELGSSVFFRREKIRRHVFILLLEVYREAGERNLAALLEAQIGFSNAYLRSPVAQGEQRYIRQIENSDWRRRYELGTAEVRYHLAYTFVLVAQAASAAADSAREQSLNEVALRDPKQRAYVEEQKRQLAEQRRKNMEEFRKTLDKLSETYTQQTKGIETGHKNTVVSALASNFELVGISEEVKKLAEFRALQSQKQAFDEYVLKEGFDENAANALVALRTSLDELTRELQKRRANEQREAAPPP
ncbi:MAG: hypothetical protein AB7O52_03965 [Planctomycetota bacterium]